MAEVEKSRSNHLQRSFLSLAQRLLPVPKHVAVQITIIITTHFQFIMDGNRRYARKLNLDPKNVIVGHQLGFERLEKTLDWCWQLGIECVSLFAFSIDNFKRQSEEVDMLMDLLAEKLDVLANNYSLVEKYQVAIRIVGNIDLLPERVRGAVKQATEMTSKYNKRILNICCPYTSRHEMTVATNALFSELRKSPKSGKQFEDFLMIRQSPPLDLLIRTSGEVRLSDFMLWQCCEGCQIAFVDDLWPELKLRHFMMVLFKYCLNK